jgi:hypothetical protein
LAASTAAAAGRGHEQLRIGQRSKTSRSSLTSILTLPLATSLDLAARMTNTRLSTMAVNSPTPRMISSIADTYN